MDAIDAIGRQGTLLIPAGRYLIRKQLQINNRVVLRGEWQAKQTLVPQWRQRPAAAGRVTAAQGDGYLLSKTRVAPSEL
jgi:hypothetical protein